MGTRNRVFSFMSNFGNNRDAQRSPTPTAPAQNQQEPFKQRPSRQDDSRAQTPTGPPSQAYRVDGESPQPRLQRERASSRPVSMIQTYQPPLMDISQDTLPELQPIFTFLNSHGNKLYQEGYFLKLDDQNIHGRPNADRTWTECFAQLVGTVLSLWDAAELDIAGQDGEVLPKFINLTDASIKMIESLPTRADNEAPLQNVLSISTAGKNRYLLHFNSHHSLIQWTAGIRLAMFEHAGLQEAYTGALIAGKGKSLNNIGTIMDRAKLPTADWARVRFGAGTPWRRCWCVITPPDEKEVQKMQKQLNKKKSAYDHSRGPVLKGDIKFYDSKKTKKMRPIATINDAYSAFAIYPQSKPLIDASTLVKVEGSITIHSNPPTTTEGFVFVMPEVHPAVTGFEMMLRWLFPVFDTFGLYGRPGRLVPDTSDIRSLMFAMPKHRRYGYLEILDVSGLILEPGSSTWRESEWRKRMKELTGKRMAAIEIGSRTNSRYSSRRSTRNSFGPSRSRVQFDDSASVRSSPSANWGQGPTDPIAGLPRTDSAPAEVLSYSPQKLIPHAHHRSVSETQGLDRFQNQYPPSDYDGAYEAPLPPPHSVGLAVSGRETSSLRYPTDIGSTPERMSSEDETTARGTPVRELQNLQETRAPEPVAAPPAFVHAAGTLPASMPYHSPELRRANSRMSHGTLSQITGPGGVAAGFPAMSRPSEDRRTQAMGQYSEEPDYRGVLPAANPKGYHANQNGLDEGLVTATAARFSFEQSSPQRNATTNNPLPPLPNTYNSSDTSRTPDERTSIPSSSTYRPATAPGHNSNPSIDSTMSTSSHLSRLQTNQSIHRKPLPTRSSSFQASNITESPSSSTTQGQPVIDQAAFDLIGRDDRHLMHTELLRQNSNVSSVYEDDASTDSPDYASTRRSVDTRESVERPRAGVMRTVGNTDLGNGTNQGAAQDAASPVQIDFGPTFNYASNRIPFTSQSQKPLQSYNAESTAQRNNAPWQSEPARRANSPAFANPPNRNVITPENMQYRSNPAEGRFVAWQPGMAATSNIAATQAGISPEQFVQQRAAAATSPMYAHHRQQSSTMIPQGQAYGRNTPTPPLIRNRSSDRLAGGHSRNNSSDVLQRPGSRGAAVAMGPSGSGDVPSNLTAREQEHIARVTGQPLVNLQYPNRMQTKSPGLVGAIEAREKSKVQMKKGINSQAVEQAIAQRQQQAMYQQQQRQQVDSMNMEYRSQVPSTHMGQYPSSQEFPPRGSSQHPVASVFGQGGGWPTPGPVNNGPEQGRQSPGLMPRGNSTPNQHPNQAYQYFPPQQQQGGQGRGFQGNRG